MSDLDDVKKVQLEFEGILKNLFEASGNTFNLLINSLKGRLPRTLIDDLHYVRDQRNSLVHEHKDYLDDRQEFLARISRIRELLLRAAAPTGDDTAFLLINKQSKLYLDVPWERHINIIHQYDGHESINQQWILRRMENGYFLIISRYTGKCFDVDGRSQDDNARVQQWSHNWDWNQHWQITALEDHSWKIIARHSNKVLDVLGASYDNRAAVVQYDWHGGDSQRWWINAAL
jgi:hypothetical protein